MFLRDRLLSLQSDKNVGVLLFHVSNCPRLENVVFDMSQSLYVGIFNYFIFYIHYCYCCMLTK